jgi:Flp pilus assembly protein TadG
MIHRLRTLAREERGAAVIELAFIAPVLATLIIGVTDISVAYGRRLELEQAVQRSIEKVMQTTGDTTVAGTIKKEAVCQINGTNPDGTCAAGRLTEDQVTVTYRLECTTAGGAVSNQDSNDADAFDAFTCANSTDTEARYIIATATDTYTPMFKMHFGTGANGVYDLSATAGVRVQ